MDGKPPQQAILDALHLLAMPGNPIIVATEMEQSVHDVTDYLGLPCCAKSARLRTGLIHAYENLAEERPGQGGVAVIEGQDIRRTQVP